MYRAVLQLYYVRTVAILYCNCCTVPNCLVLYYSCRCKCNGKCTCYCTTTVLYSPFVASLWPILVTFFVTSLIFYLQNKDWTKISIYQNHQWHIVCGSPSLYIKFTYTLHEYIYRQKHNWILVRTYSIVKFSLACRYTDMCACAYVCVHSVDFQDVQYDAILYNWEEREREGVKELAKTSRKSVCGSLRVPCPDMNQGQE